MVKNIFSLFCLFILTPTLTLANVTIVHETTDHKNKSTFTSQMWISGNDLRTEFQSEKGNQALIYKGDKKLFWVIDNKTKSYTEMTEEKMMELKSQFNSTMDQLKKQFEQNMAKASPEQRVKMQAVLDRITNKSENDKASEEKTKFQTISQNEKVHQWQTKHLLGQVNGIKSEELWVANIHDLGLSPTDIEAFYGFSKFMESLTKNLPGSSTSLFHAAFKAKDDSFATLPVKVIHYKNQQPKVTTQLKSITKNPIDPTFFSIPKGYKKREIPTT